MPRAGAARDWRACARPIPRIDAPSIEGFEREHRRPSRPVILRGALVPEVSLRCSIDALRETLRGADVPAVAVDSRGLAEYSTARGVPYVKRGADDVMEAHARGDAREYVVFPIDADAPVLPTLGHEPSYGASARWKRSRFWLAPPDVRGALHFDLPDNLHAQLSGRKEWVLFPPRDTLQLEPHAPWSAVPNYARVDPLGEASTDLGNAHAWHAVLEPGEMLYVPRRWWHQARSIDTSVGVNYWWAEGRTLCVVRSAEIFARLRGLRL